MTADTLSYCYLLVLYFFSKQISIEYSLLGVSSGQDYFSVNAATGLVTVRQQLTSDPARPTFYQVKSTKTSIWPKNLVTHHVSHARIGGGGGSRGSRPPFLQNSNFLKYKVNNYRKYAQTPTATRSNIDRHAFIKCLPK